MSYHITESLIAEAAAFGLKKKELERFCHAQGRTPNKEELAVCGALWSEHCSYKSSRIHLKRFHTTGEHVLQGPGENAGIVSINANWGIAFKMESHNHPSYIEPYQGAATGVGGILRDVFCMGAKPIANMNCLRFGEGTWNAHLVKHTVKGIADYGNSVGIPTIMGDTSFHYNYTKNILVNAFTAGIIHKDGIFLGVLGEERAENTPPDLAIGQDVTPDVADTLFPKHENVLIYFGSATGRDGVHGATMSSSEFSASSECLKPTVQVGDPFAEKVVMEATHALIAEGLVIGLQDMGAAGLTSSSVEMASRSGCGVAIDLSAVPQRAANMQPWEILLSESQERMVCAVKPQDADRVLNLLETFDLPNAIIGRVNPTGQFVCTFDNRIVCDIAVPVLVDDAPKYDLPLQDRKQYLEENKTLRNEANMPPQIDKKAFDKASIGLKLPLAQLHADILAGSSVADVMEKHAEALKSFLSHPNIAHKKPLYDLYCGTVKGQTITASGGTQKASSGVVRLPKYAQEKGGNLGLATAAGCEERWVEGHPLYGSILSALKVARKIIATGGTPLGMTDCLNFGAPAQPAVMRQFSDAVDGISIVAKNFNIPVVSGNVSFNNQTDGRAIPPTPMVGIVGRVKNVSRISLSEIPYNESHTCLAVYHVKAKSAQALYEVGLMSWIAGEVNDFSLLERPNLKTEKDLWAQIKQLQNRCKVRFCRPVGHGGLHTGLIQMLGQEGHLWEYHYSPDYLALPAQEAFAEGCAGFIVAVPEENKVEFKKWLQDGTSCLKVGDLVKTQHNQEPEHVKAFQPFFH